eukprot:SAG11_NODE_971_length_6351_cov_4.531190_5_plen_103_part_00
MIGFIADACDLKDLSCSGLAKRDHKLVVGLLVVEVYPSISPVKSVVPSHNILVVLPQRLFKPVLFRLASITSTCARNLLLVAQLVVLRAGTRCFWRSRTSRI